MTASIDASHAPPQQLRACLRHMVETADGTLAGYVRVEWADVPNEPTRYWVVPHIDPAYRDTALWMALADSAIARNLELAADHESDTGKVMEGFSEREMEPDVCQWYEGAGVHRRDLRRLHVQTHRRQAPGP